MRTLQQPAATTSRCVWSTRRATARRSGPRSPPRCRRSRGRVRRCRTRARRSAATGAAADRRASGGNQGRARRCASQECLDRLVETHERVLGHSTSASTARCGAIIGSGRQQIGRHAGVACTDVVGTHLTATDGAGLRAATMATGARSVSRTTSPASCRVRSATAVDGPSHAGAGETGVARAGGHRGPIVTGRCRWRRRVTSGV